MTVEPPRRQMARRVGRRRPPLRSVGFVVAGLLVIAVVVSGMAMLARQPAASSPPTAGGRPSASASSSLIGVIGTPTPRASSIATDSPPTYSPGATPAETAPPSPAPTASPSGTPDAKAAPTSAADFDVRGQVIDIGFPLRSDTDYHYRDNWLEKRAGAPNSYNHARIGPSGNLVREHDGIDIYGPEGAPVLAPFDGTIIDPATKWTPWEPDRYGLTVVVQSDEPDSAGYMAVLVHLEDVWVDLGQHVTRGQVLGALGRTGDAEEVAPQLHIELRAPFLINWSPIGEDRQVDAFNPYPSLVAADPHRH